MLHKHAIARAYPRIHITLIDLAGISHRRYGGAGYSLDGFPIEARVSHASDSAVVYHSSVDARDQHDVSSLLVRMSTRLSEHFRVEVMPLPPQHAGFGTKTAMLSAISAACNALQGDPLTADDLKRVTRRGGASGVGVNAFFQGGLIVDLGHPESTGTQFVPSSAGHPISPPPVAVRLSFPTSWQTHLFLPKQGHRWSGDREVALFQRNTPLPRHEVLHILAEVYHGIVPAVVEQDHRLLRRAIQEIHHAGMKKRELSEQHPCVSRLIDALGDGDSAAVGMSSMGPLLYAIVPEDRAPSMARTAQRIHDSGQAEYLGQCSGRNSGHEIVVDSEV